MERPATYRVCVRGELGPQWSTWFEDLAVSRRGDGTTSLVGTLPDQAALHGLLERIRDLALPLLSVETIEPTDPCRGHADDSHERIE